MSMNKQRTKSSTAIASIAMVLCIAVLGTVPAHATGLMDCASDRDQWRSQDELREHITHAGWEVRKVKVDDGCYEVYGTTPEGARVEAYFDPVTFEKLLVARRGVILFRKSEATAAPD